MNDLVSIIMPSYNTATYIGLSIKSVLDQTYDNWELLVVDDCSTDNTDEVVQSFLTDDRIRYLKNDSNSGAAVSRNRALREAKGKWIAFLDSDDLWLPDKLEKQIKYMIDNHYHFSYTNYCEIDESGEKLGVIVTGPRRITRSGFFNYCWPGCLTVMYDAEISESVIQIEDIKKNNDYAMWLKVSQFCDCYLFPKTMAFYRRRDGSISNHNYLSLIKWHYRLFREAEKEPRMLALINTGRNLVFGVIKKIVFITRNMPDKRRDYKNENKI